MNIFSLETCTTLSLHNITWEKQEHENFQEGLTMRRGNITVFSKATLAALAGVLVLGLLLGSSATVHAQN
jgi:hypothetical protein